jgi:diguanylate cyclase (GGDEF)-like protein/PAS domain S-box-containing protein
MSASTRIKKLMSGTFFGAVFQRKPDGKAPLSENLILGRLMWPLASVLVVLAVMVSAILWYQQELRLRDTVAQRIADIPNQMEVAQTQQLAVMSTLLERITSNPALHEALRSRNRDRLLADNRDLLEELRLKYGISHFYFQDKDRHNVLRVQFPDKQGGRIDRYTTLQAERTGKTAGGLELGSFGLLTLRVVQPVFSQGELIGYVELGKEIEDILAGLHRPDGVEVAVAIHKEVLSREAWETGMKLVGREFGWNDFPDDVLTYASLWPMPTGMLNQYLAEHDSAQLNLEESAGGRSWRAAAAPIKDASGRAVGHLLIMLDISAQQAAFRKIVVVAATVSAAVLALLMVFLLGLLKKTDSCLIAQQADLQKTQAELQAIFDTVVDGIVMADERGQIELVNPAFQKIFGYRIDEVQGRNISMLMTEPDRVEHDNHMQRYRAGGKRKIIGIGREVLGRRKDGSIFSMDIAVNEALIDGRPLFVGLVRDITARKQAEKKLAQSLQLQRKFQQDASVDALTGLHNRRWMEETFTRQIARRSKEGLGAILIMLDVDHFKRYNDTHGHAGGDCALRALGKTLSERIRPNELAARYGGEEFAILLPDANLGQAVAVAERLRVAVENAPILDTDGARLPSITISLGVARMNKGDTLETLIKSADAALYRAKLAGRNGVSL